jgi:hypothetical protein
LRVLLVESGVSELALVRALVLPSVAPAAVVRFGRVVL